VNKRPLCTKLEPKNMGLNLGMLIPLFLICFANLAEDLKEGQEVFLRGRKLEPAIYTIKSVTEESLILLKGGATRIAERKDIIESCTPEDLMSKATARSKETNFGDKASILAFQSWCTQYGLADYSKREIAIKSAAVQKEVTTIEDKIRKELQVEFDKKLAIEIAKLEEERRMLGEERKRIASFRNSQEPVATNASESDTDKARRLLEQWADDSLTKIKLKISEPRTRIYDGTKKYVFKAIPTGKFSLDARKTDSIVSPIVGTVAYEVKWYANDKFVNIHQIQVTLAFQSSQWVIKTINRYADDTGPANDEDETAWLKSIFK